MKSYLFALTLAGCLAAGAPAHAQQSYTITELGSVPAFNNYRGRSVNAAGQAAVSSYKYSGIGHVTVFDGSALHDLPVFRPGNEA